MDIVRGNNYNVWIDLPYLIGCPLAHGLGVRDPAGAGSGGPGPDRVSRRRGVVTTTSCVSWML